MEHESLAACVALLLKHQIEKNGFTLAQAAERAALRGTLCAAFGDYFYLAFGDNPAWLAFLPYCQEILLALGELAEGK